MTPVTAAVVLALVWSVPQQPPPRDPVAKPGMVQSAPAQAASEIQKKVLELRQQAAQRLAAGDFEGAIAALEAAAMEDPSNPAGHQLVATYYFEKAQRDATLSAIQRNTYIQEGIAATDRALALDPDYLEALTYKSILTRMQALAEPDATEKTRLLAEADALRNRAMARRGAAPEIVRAAPAAPPPPRPAQFVDGMAPVRVGGNIKTPTKIKDVRPIYPEDALAARVQGVVIIEATIDPTGKVRDANVLRSIPMLDDAARQAVLQWEFTPTYVNEAPVPVIMTVTVNFTLDR